MQILDDNKTKGVLTTKSIAAQTTDITHVTLDDEGDWQFLGDGDFDASDLLILPLGQIIELDKTLGTLPNIRRKETYIRKKKSAKWQKL
ncbi:hypothetical protein [Bradymonas sediminis]|uniref:Uncharacterized protein n=1 Tax=Bradymonas sediminis TaxID=1548548 RepID=A0A2Z4FLD5_9DELT|nr:hypothetical protein [Bradymonas sediminis]AWV89773.1 hypothetical protein DN745_10660 [Bradymonas sediminis]TDP76482.1 hypothetical protein DFR33_102111 [Bradymonas sediminis]